MDILLIVCIILLSGTYGYRAGLRREASAKRELKRITPSHAELLKLAAHFPAPQEWYDEGGQTPNLQSPIPNP